MLKKQNHALYRGWEEKGQNNALPFQTYDL